MITLESNLENKAKFFAQYWGQKILINDGDTELVNKTYIEWGMADNYLLLTPLSQITDDDAIEVAKIRWQGLKENHSYRKGDAAEGKRVVDTINNTSAPSHIVLQIFDYLRSRGYALPFMGLGTDKLIEYGWIKLKQQESKKLGN